MTTLNFTATENLDTGKLDYSYTDAKGGVWTIHNPKTIRGEQNNGGWLIIHNSKGICAPRTLKAAKEVVEYHVSK